MADGSSQFLRRRQMMWGSNLFHLGVLVFSWPLRRPADADLGLRHVGVGARFQAGDGIWSAVSPASWRSIGMHAADAPAAVRSAHPQDLVVRRSRIVLTLCGCRCCWASTTIRSRIGHLDGKEMVKFMDWAQGLYRSIRERSDLVLDAHPSTSCNGARHDDVPDHPVYPAGAVWSAPIWYLGRRGYQVVRSSGRPVAGANASRRNVQAAE